MRKWQELKKAASSLDQWGFPQVGRVPFEGGRSDNPLAFKYWDPEFKFRGQPVGKTIRFSGAIWHFQNPLGDPFGPGTSERPWLKPNPGLTDLNARFDVWADFLAKFAHPEYPMYHAWHGEDVTGPIYGDDGRLDFHLFRDRLASVGEHMLAAQKRTGLRCAWGTNNTFSAKEFVHGGGTSRHRPAWTLAAAQNALCLELTHKLGGLGYVFWDGRGGYDDPMTADIAAEQLRAGRLINGAMELADEIGFTGDFMIEPKGREPKNRMYNASVGTVFGWAQYVDDTLGLGGEFAERLKINFETNHAQMEGLSAYAELMDALKVNRLGGIDSNMGERSVGWDTDNPVQDPLIALQLVWPVLTHPGKFPGTYNLDCKPRRGDFTAMDMFYMFLTSLDHIGLGVRIAAKLDEWGVLGDYFSEQYGSWRADEGPSIDQGQFSYRDAVKTMTERRVIAPPSSLRESMLRQCITDAIVAVQAE